MESALVEAVRANDSSTCESLFRGGAVDDRATWVAASLGYTKLCEMCIHWRMSDFDALRIASFYGHYDTCLLLLKFGSRDKGSLKMAAKNGHRKVAQLLIQYGMDTTSLLSTNGNTTRAMMRVCTKEQIVEAKRLFVVKKIMKE